MDHNYDYEDSSAAVFPLPFRVLFLICLGILGWAMNLHCLHSLDIDTTSILDIRLPPDHAQNPLPTIRTPGFKYLPHPSTTYSSIYRLFAFYSVWCFTLWCLYRFATYQNALAVDVFKYLPAVAALGLLISLVCPFDILEAPLRDAFILAIRRCVAPAHHILFCDIILADIFTSFAKVFGDLWLSLCMLLPGGSLLALPQQEGWTRWILPTLMSIPYLVRFRQCMIEYMASNNRSRKPFYNAVKYASSFPVIFLSAAQRIVVKELVAEKGENVTDATWHGEHPIFRLWLFCAAINTIYSFWWDVTNDWGFDLLLPSRVKATRSVSAQPPRPLMLPTLHSKPASLASSNNSSNIAVSNDDHAAVLDHEASPRPQLYPFGLRSNLLLPLHFYPFIILANLILRLTWSIKLSPHLHSQSEGSGVIFWTEVAELVRRWMWVFLRVEWEIVKEAFEKRRIRRSGGTSEEEFEMVVEDFDRR